MLHSGRPIAAPEPKSVCKSILGISQVFIRHALPNVSPRQGNSFGVLSLLIKDCHTYHLCVRPDGATGNEVQMFERPPVFPNAAKRDREIQVDG
jgi:hypothetical protein